ncbi:MAG: CHC2 zinc finger domain-containing protein [Gammaproteobacteria bacterium]
MEDWVDFHALKEAVSLEAVLCHYQVPGLRRRRRQLEGCCPIHRGKRDDSFRASLSKNVFHCFACQAHGNVLDFVAAMEQCSVREAAARLQQWFGVTGPAALARPAPGSARERELVREKEGCNPPLGFALTGVDHAHPYLEQRGIDRATAAEFGVGFYGAPGLMSGRIVIPIRNQSGEIVAYAGRALDRRLPKYKLPAGFRKALELFNIQRALATRSKTVIVVEGYFDCLQVHQAGFPYVVALMGTSLSAGQERVLVEHFDRVVLMFDSDAAGRAASRVISAKLSEKCSVVLANLPDGAQPDQLSPTDIRDVIFESTRGRATLFETQS